MLPSSTGLNPAIGLQVAPPSQASGAGPTAKAGKTAQDFEAFFVSSMLDHMTSGLKPNKLFGGGSGEQMFRSLMNQEYGKAIAARGSLGLGSTIASEMMRLQQKADGR